MRRVFKKDLCVAIEETVEARELIGNGKMVLVGLSLMIAVLGYEQRPRTTDMPRCSCHHSSRFYQRSLVPW
jgi:hypothetical protein